MQNRQCSQSREHLLSRPVELLEIGTGERINVIAGRNSATDTDRRRIGQEELHVRIGAGLLADLLDHLVGTDSAFTIGLRFQSNNEAPDVIAEFAAGPLARSRKHGLDVLVARNCLTHRQLGCGGCFEGGSFPRARYAVDDAGVLARNETLGNRVV